MVRRTRTYNDNFCRAPALGGCRPPCPPSLATRRTYAWRAEGDSVTRIKNLKQQELEAEGLVDGAEARHRDQEPPDNENEIEGRTDKVESLVLRTEFLKKA